MCMLQYRQRRDLSAEVAGITSVNQAESVCIAIRTYKNRERERKRRGRIWLYGAMTEGK